MKLRFICLIAGVLLLMLLAVHPVLAKGPFTSLIVSGGELTHELEIREPGLLEFFSFADYYAARLPQPPENADNLLAQAYVIKRYGQDDRNGRLVQFDSLHFLPAKGDKPGLVYYDGVFNGSSEYDKKWYRANSEANAAFQRLINAQLDPVGSFVDERKSLITTVGMLLAFAALLEWLRARRRQRVTVE